MAHSDTFNQIFSELKSFLQNYEDQLILKESTFDNYYLDTPYTEVFKKELFFGAVQIKKNYVSYHLMPVYMYPDLMDQVSPALKKRMQGKSCFNFTKPDPELFSELSELTDTSFQRLKSEGILS